jgi:hypothetical protein
MAKSTDVRPIAAAVYFLPVTLPIAKARGFSGYPELQESVPGQCPGIYA